LSGAEIALVCREAGLLALSMDNSIETTAAADIRVSVEHLGKALADVKLRG
jgi:SpoVK/Ycf46/Vps4 family AAA+-type ATPase